MLVFTFPSFNEKLSGKVWQFLLIMPFIIMQLFNKQNINTEVSEALELRVSDLITEDEVHIEACDNVTEPTDIKRWEIQY